MAIEHSFVYNLRLCHICTQSTLLVLYYDCATRTNENDGEIFHSTYMISTNSIQSKTTQFL